MNLQRLNVFLLGIAFHFIFFSFQTSVFIQQTVVNSIKTKPEYKFKGDGYVSLCITYSVFALSNWLAPSIIAITGIKYGMFLGTLTYAFYSASFIYPTTELFYAAAAIIGLGAGPLWTAQGSYLAKNSDEATSSQNAGIFWSMLQSSILFGNLFVYFAFSSQTTIEDGTRYIVYGVLTGVCLLGAMVILMLRDNSRTLMISEETLTALGQFKSAVELSKTFHMILLAFAFLFTGQLLSFFTGVYGTAIGATSQFGPDSKKYIGLSGIFIGIGEILGGSIFGLMGAKVNSKVGRGTIFGLGYVVIMVASALIYINLPPDSSLPSDQVAKLKPIVEPRLWIAFLASTLLGFGDACFNTQIYSLLMSSYSNNSLGAFALFKFMQSLGSAVAFLYSTKLNLHYQLYILASIATVATFCFIFVDKQCKSSHRSIEKSDSQTTIVGSIDNQNGDVEGKGGKKTKRKTSKVTHNYQTIIPTIATSTGRGNGYDNPVRVADDFN